jgi:hypothetical protein
LEDGNARESSDRLGNLNGENILAVSQFSVSGAPSPSVPYLRNSLSWSSENVGERALVKFRYRSPSTAPNSSGKRKFNPCNEMGCCEVLDM